MTTKTSEEAIFAFLSNIPQSQAEIARKAGINRSNITGWLRKLESKGQAKKTLDGLWKRTQQYNNATTQHVSFDIENPFDTFFHQYHPSIDPYSNLDRAFYILLDDFATKYMDVIDDNENSSMVNFVLNVLECSEEDLEESVQRLKRYRLYIELNKHN
jgi:biotin operon repressor